jgi:opacity protein-like surface antigen
MLPRNVVAFAVAGLALAAATLEAQDTGLSVFVQGGVQSASTDLGSGGSASLESGFNLGGGLALELHPNVALRGEVAYARSDGNGPAIGTTTFSRLLYGGDVQVRYPFANGLMPYVFAGAGGVRISEQGGDADAVNSPAARLGGGLAFAVPGVPVRVFAQGSAWHYKFFGWPGMDAFQWDVSYSAGLSYRLR